VKVAIIGGGAAGMITAYLLDPSHEVTVFERQPILGGNIRTLGGNVECAALAPDVLLDSGVIEFSPEHFPTMHRLLDVLGVETRQIPVTTGLTTAAGQHIYSAGKLAASALSGRDRLAAKLRMMSLVPDVLRFRWRAQTVDPDEALRSPIGDYLGRSSRPFWEWLRLLLVYGYSIPRSKIDDFPAAIALPTLLAFTGKTTWTSVVGGIYSYIDAILNTIRGRVLTGVEIESVTRDREGVLVRRSGAEAERFDRVVIATTPAQVLRLLRDPTPAEHRRFAAWRDNEADAVIHTDSSMYARRGILDYSEFDLFADPPGYNAYLNRLCGVPPSHPTDYHFSYNLEAEIDPASVLHVQPHTTPMYTVDAFTTRPEIQRSNGDNHTFFAGAWLGNGLHEGAVISAVEIVRRLGGRRL